MCQSASQCDAKIIILYEKVLVNTDSAHTF